MALTANQREEIANYTFHRSGWSRGSERTVDILQNVIRRFGYDFDNSELAQARATIQNILNAFDRGSELQIGPGTDAIRPGITDWGLDFLGGAFGWRVRVIVRNGNTGELVDRLVVVQSDEVLTADEIRERAINEVMQNPGPAGKYRDTSAWSESVLYYAEILTAGKRA